MEEGIDPVGNPMNFSCPRKLHMQMSRRLLTDLQLTKCLLFSRTSAVSRVTWLVPADGLGAEVICVTSRREDLRAIGQPFLSLAPCHRDSRAWVQSSWQSIHQPGSLSHAVEFCLPTSAEHDLWMRNAYLMYLSWRSTCYHSITYAVLTNMFEHIYIYIYI